MKRKPKIGERVAWTDPDNEATSVKGTVKHIRKTGDVIHLTLTDDWHSDVLLHELTLL